MRRAREGGGLRGMKVRWWMVSRFVLLTANDALVRFV